MYIANIDYYDLDNVRCHGTYYFNMNNYTSARFVYMEPDDAMILATIIKRADSDKKAISFEDLERTLASIIKASFGRRDPGTNKFIPDLKGGEDFINSEAYYEFAGSLLLDLDKFAEFVKAVNPSQNWAEVDAKVKEAKEYIEGGNHE